MATRILYITNGICGPGGLERTLSVRARLLAERYGYDLHFVTLGERGRERFYDFPTAMQTHDLPWRGSPLARLRSWARGIAETARRLKPDFAVVCDDGFKGFCVPVLCGLHCPIVYERHVSRLILAGGRAPSLAARAQFGAMRVLGRRFARFVALTPGNLDEWPMKNVEVIPNPVPFYPSEPSRGDRRRVIAVGKISAQKNYGALLSAWKRAHARFPEWKLDLFGSECDGGELRRAIHNEGLEENFRLHEPTRDIMREYLASSICAMSSLYEGFGMMLVEAMACGVPCAAFDCPHGPRDIIRHGEDGLLVPPGDATALGAALEELMGNDARRAAMAARARENVKRYAADAIVARWDALYRAVLDERKEGRA